MATDKATPGDQKDKNLPPWLQKAQKNGDMLSAAKRKAIQKRIDASHKKKKSKGK